MIRTAPALRFSLAVLIAGAAAGCGGAPPVQPSAGLASAESGATVAPASAYQLTERELKMNCKELTGTMRVRILQVRGTTSAQNGTIAARTLQSGATKIWGGPGYGSDPAADRDRDLAQLEAYNRQLASKKCPTLDLPAELNGTNATNG